MMGNEVSIRARGTIKICAGHHSQSNEIKQTLFVAALDRPPTEQHATSTFRWCCLEVFERTQLHAYRSAYDLAIEPASAESCLVVATLVALDHLPTNKDATFTPEHCHVDAPQHAETLLRLVECAPDSSSFVQLML
jgi:hypothetical protein